MATYTQRENKHIHTPRKHTISAHINLALPCTSISTNSKQWVCIAQRHIKSNCAATSSISPILSARAHSFEMNLQVCAAAATTHYTHTIYTNPLIVRHALANLAPKSRHTFVVNTAAPQNARQRARGAKQHNRHSITSNDALGAWLYSQTGD